MIQALECGAASKLSGKLQWASQSAFKSLGRAMLRALLDHARRNTNPVLSKELQQALKWWLQLLQLDLRSAALCVVRLLEHWECMRALRIGMRENGLPAHKSSYTCTQMRAARHREQLRFY